MYLASGFGINGNSIDNSGVVTPLTEGVLIRAGHRSSDTPSPENYTISIGKIFILLYTIYYVLNPIDFSCV